MNFFRVAISELGEFGVNSSEEYNMAKVEGPAGLVGPALRALADLIDPHPPVQLMRPNSFMEEDLSAQLKSRLPNGD